MVLQNYWAWLRAANLSNSSSAVTGITGLKDTSGNNIIQFYGSNAQTISNKTLAHSTLTSLVFGTGTTPPEALDYALEADATSSLTLSGTLVQNYDSEKVEFIFSTNATNNTASDITITEIGIIKKIYPTSSAVDSLFVREILDTPITIAAGETKTINYVWTMQ